jgi:hypothetical protein
MTTLKRSVDDLEKGKLSVEEIAPLLEDARELHERMAILMYLSHNKIVKQEGASAEEERVAQFHQEESLIDSKLSEALDAGAIEAKDKNKDKKGVKLNFNLFSTADNEPVNQINLLDAIAEKVPDEGMNTISITETEVKIEVEHDVDLHQQHTSINQVIAKVSEKLSLNDKLADGAEKTSLAAKLSRKPIKDLNEEIGLNQKFLFMNDLFGGENGLYKEAITTLNGYNALEQATEFLNQLKLRHNWDMESISVTKFIDLVERKFLV